MIGNLAILFLATLSYRVCMLSLSPVYGSVSASAINLNGVLEPLVWVAATLTHRRVSRFMVLLPTIGYLAPIILSILYHHSDTMGPFYGPLINYLITSWPILFLSLLSNVNFLAYAISPKTKDRSPVEEGRIRIGLESMMILICVGIFKYVAVNMLRAVSLILDRSASTPGMITSHFGMHALLSILWTYLARSRGTFWFGILSSTYTMFFITHIPTAQNTVSVNGTLLDSNYALVARQESLSGYISVLDNLKDGFRVMRCDHSLLGGEWINKPEGHPARFNEPIYSIFVMLEAVRLLETPSLQPPLETAEKKKKKKQALIMWVIYSFSM